MLSRNGLRSRLLLFCAATFATVALPAATASAALPRTYVPTPIAPTDEAVTPGGAFGWGIYSADLTGDGHQDLLVAQGQLGTRDIPTQVLIYDGVSGKHIDTIKPPEDNPDTATGGYVSPELAFVYVETMPDLGSCPSGDSIIDTDKICNDPEIGPKDGIPEIIVGARALRVNKDNGALAPTTGDPRIGRGYVIDGKTRAVLKRIDMPVADRNAVVTRSGVNSVQAFGRTMASPQGMPPCAGKASENNDTGVGPCPKQGFGTGDLTAGENIIRNPNLPNAQVGDTVVGDGLPPGAEIFEINKADNTVTFAAPPTSAADPLGTEATKTLTGVRIEVADWRYPQAVRIGDLDGGGEPDIVVTARGFAETRGPTGSAAAGSECKTITTGTANCGAGKVWIYRGEDILGKTTGMESQQDPRTILDTAWKSIQNPDAQTTGGEYGGNLFRVGDIVGPTTANNAPDGIPDFVISFRGSDFPLKAPDLSWGLNMGSADLFSGATGNRIRTLVSPEPQMRSTFSGGFNAGRAVGDLGATDNDDILLGAPFQNLQYADQGRLWVFNGDATAGGGGENTWNFSMLNDPEAYIGGNFGGAQTGVGDIVKGPGAPANEVLVGGFRFDNFTEASQTTVPDLNFMNATFDKNLMTIPHPESRTGDGFGVGITPMGDLNDDGFIDFAASAYFYDDTRPKPGKPSETLFSGGAGRAWIFKSDNSPLPAPPTAPAATPTGPATTTPSSEKAPALQPGRCANRTIGTSAGETLMGTLAGDEIFGFAGNDTIMAFEGQDCVDGGDGADKIQGGDANDKLIGGIGGDRLDGGDGRDSLYGGAHGDRLLGGFGRDLLAGGSGNDYLLGGADADRLYGENGTDRIVAGGGRNEIDGGNGNDSIDARNGEVDRIRCGLGRDKVVADRIDRFSRCEVITFGKKRTRK